MCAPKTLGARDVLGVVVAAILFALLTVAGVATARGPSPRAIPLEICQQQDPETPDPECETEEVGQQGGGQSGGGSGGGRGGAQETHDISLGSGREHTDTGAGEEITLDLGSKENSGKADDAVPEAPDPDRPSGPKPDEITVPGAGGSDRPEVSTSGGAGLGGGSSFDFVTSDEALSSFAVPPFLLPIYISAGRAYGVPWNVLASINKIETDFGRLGACAVSSAGARGWMQFMPSTWDSYGVDASGDGLADPCNPVDAIYAAARYLSASGASTDLRGAVFAYNHAGWYVDEVLSTAGVYGSLPAGLVAETGSLAFGHFPVHGKVLYGDDFRAAEQAGRVPRGVRIYPREGSRAVATQAVTVERILVPRTAAAAFSREFEARSAAEPAQAGAAPPKLLRDLIDTIGPALPLVEALTGLDLGGPRTGAKGRGADDGGRSADLNDATDSAAKGGRDRELPPVIGITRVGRIGIEVSDAAGNRYTYEGLAGLRRGVQPGERLRGGEAIGSLRASPDRAMLFSTRAAGGTPVDPRPLLDGYRLQEAADYYHAIEPLGDNPFVLDQTLAADGVIGGTQEELARKVLSDSGIEIYPCGREDVERGIADRRILGALLYLRKAGMTLTVTSLRCGHGFYTASGNVSAHSFGAAVDIAAFNGQPVLGNQGPGSLTEQAIRLLMQLDGEAQPTQLISLMDLGGPSFSMADHADHLHMGYDFDASLGLGRSGDTADPVLFGGIDKLAPDDHDHGTEAEERRLSERFGEIENPEVRRGQGSGVRVEAESRGEARAAERLAREDAPLAATPASSGAELIDVAVPAEADGITYALGEIDGAASGWARRQVVVLEHRDGVWRLVGPPRDDRGRPENPDLSAIASNAAGTGYAVGARGAVVELRGRKRPLLLDSPTKSSLADVTLAASGELRGYAVGAGGTALELSGHDVSGTHADGRPDLSSVASSPDGPLAAGEGANGEPALLTRDGGGRWQPVALGFSAAPGSGIRLTRVAARGDELWVAGAISDSGTAGRASELPFAARRSGGRWQTYCAATPALANVSELGEPSERPCDGGLVAEPGERGPVTDLALTGEGAIVTTHSGWRLLTPGAESFRPMPSGPRTISSLAVSAAGEGWLLGPDGRMARVSPDAGSRESPDSPLAVTGLPADIDAAPVAVAADPGGDRVLAFGGGGSAVLVDGSWSEAEGTGLGVREATWAGEALWAIDERGTLISSEGGEGEWEAAGLDELEERTREELIDSAGGEPLLPAGESSPTGFQALAFGSEIEGFAVGADGLVAHHLNGGWEVESAPTAATLRDVAAGPAGVVAVGDSGTLLERDGEQWTRVPGPRELVAQEDFTAVEALADGSFLAAAGGAVVERPDGGAWRAAELPPLGLPVSRLAGYRDDAGHLNAVVLTSGEAPALLLGTRAGWRPLPLPEGMTASAFAPEPGSERIWVAGLREGRAATVTLDLGARSEDEGQ